MEKICAYTCVFMCVRVCLRLAANPAQTFISLFLVLSGSDIFHPDPQALTPDTVQTFPSVNSFNSYSHAGKKDHQK